MLLPWSKPTTIAIGANAIAMQEHKASAKLIAQSETYFDNIDVMSRALLDSASQVNSKYIRLMLSNHFVRYIAIPWQDGVVSRQEWLSIAEHAFRKRFGQIADQWEVRVSLNAYGQNIVASAVDQTLIDGLQAVADVNQWHIEAIEPLLSVVLSAVILEQNNSWIILGEPSRVLLAERASGQWECFSMINPPRGMEIDQIKQLLIRQLAIVKSIDRPKQILSCFSPEISGELQIDGLHLKSVRVGELKSATNSALWMASI